MTVIYYKIELSTNVCQWFCRTIFLLVHNFIVFVLNQTLFVFVV